MYYICQKNVSASAIIGKLLTAGRQFWMQSAQNVTKIKCSLKTNGFKYRCFFICFITEAKLVGN